MLITKSIIYSFWLCGFGKGFWLGSERSDKMGNA